MKTLIIRLKIIYLKIININKRCNTFLTILETNGVVLLTIFKKRSDTDMHLNMIHFLRFAEISTPQEGLRSPHIWLEQKLVEGVPAFDPSPPAPPSGCVNFYRFNHILIKLVNPRDIPK